METQNKKRPFELGDQLTIFRPARSLGDTGRKIQGECLKISSDGIITVGYLSSIERREITRLFTFNGKSFDDTDFIMQIKKPRKGSQDARKITSMLAKEYRDFVLDVWRDEHEG